MRGKKNDYSMTFYNNNDMVIFLQYVHDTDKAIKWVENLIRERKLKNNHTHWTHAMVYDRRTRQKIDRIVNQ